MTDPAQSLLAAWRSSKAPDLAERVEALLISQADQRPKIGAANQSFQKAWLARAAEGVQADLPHLLSTLEAGTGPQMKVRIEALRPFAPHPLLAREVTRWLVDTPFEGPNRVLCLTPALALLEACADPRSLPTLERITHPSARLETVRRCGMKLWKPLVALTGQARTWTSKPHAVDLDAVPVPAPRPKQDLSSLWQQVFDAPDDVQRRLVLADALQEAGDPRGELITLQSSRGPGARVSKREKELLAQYRFDFMGPLVRVMGVPEYEGGLLIKGTVYAHLPEAPPLTEPAWQAIRQLDFQNSTSAVAATVLSNPLLRRLEVVRGPTVNELVEFLPSLAPLPWKHLELRFGTAPAGGLLLEQLARLPALEVLAMPFSDGPALRRALPQKLRVYGAWGDDEAFAPLLRALTGSSLERLVFVTGAMTLHFDLRTGALTVFNELHEALVVPAEVKTVEVVTKRKYPERMRNFLRTLGPATVREGTAPSMFELLRGG